MTRQQPLGKLPLMKPLQKTPAGKLPLRRIGRPKGHLEADTAAHTKTSNTYALASGFTSLRAHKDTQIQPEAVMKVVMKRTGIYSGMVLAYL